MKKLFLLLIVATISISANAQKLKEYKASNNLIYKIGDTIKLAKGSSANGNFLFVNLTGAAAAITDNGSSANSGQFNAPAQYAGTNVIIKKIISVTKRGATKTLFYVDAGNKYVLDIDNAINACEVMPCAHK